MLEPNTLLQNRYRIEQPIGKGGMGAVYRAFDTRLHVTVALKETLKTDDVTRRAFEREARLLAQLRHSVLPRVSDHFVDGTGQFLVMDYIPGDDLGGLLARAGGRFPSPDVIHWALRWFDQLLDALEYLHSQTPPIIHRDIKPQNLKLTVRGDIILLDFGLARPTRTDATTRPSNDSVSIFGYTPSYAPLEQIQGGPPDPRSDIYSLAATLYHLLTGMRPLDAVSRAAALMSRQPDPLLLASVFDPNIPTNFAQLIQRAMNPLADGRPATATLLRQMLQAVRAGAPLELAGSPQKKIEESISFKLDRAPPSPVAPPPPEPPTVVSAAGTLIRRFTAESPVLAIALSPDGELLATGHEDYVVALWRFADGQLVHRLSGHVHSVLSVAFTRDGKRLVTGSEDRLLRFWDVATGKPAPIAGQDAHSAEYVAVHPDGKLLASGGWGGSIMLWDYTEHALSYRNSLMTGFIQSLTFSPDGHWLAAGGYDGSIRLWELGNEEPTHIFDGGNNFVLSLVFSPDGQRLVSGSSLGSRVWRLSDGRLIEKLAGHTNNVRSLIYGHTGSWLASASEDRTIRLWSSIDGSHLMTLQDHMGGVTSLALTPDGKALISGCRDGRIRIWSVTGL